ncbi:peritrophin-44-like [Cherax quadricarinatus]
MSKHLLFISLSVSCVLLLLGATEALSVDLCEPDCAGATPGTLVEDPANCTRYYVCLDDDLPTENPLSCPSGTSFDNSSLSCTGSVPCDPSCTPAVCHLTCNNSITVDSISDPMDCSIYYVCSNGDVFGPMECPASTPYFDGETCVNDKSACCGDLCVPYCQPGEIQVPDPIDCTKYYVCPETGAVKPEYHFTCPAGSNFEVALGTCVADAPCIILCTDSATTASPSFNCTTSMTCSSAGYFAKCSYCQPQYYHCTQAGHEAVVESCAGTLVFNPDPGYPYCISSSDCPYKPLF